MKFEELNKHYKNPKHLMFKKMEKILPLFSGGKFLLDLGCGTGELLLRLRNKYSELIGIDSNIRFAKKKLKGIKNIKLIEADINKINLRENSFDCISALDFFEHLKYPETVIKKVNKWLVADGQLIITVPNWYDKIIRHFGKEHKVAYGVLGWKKILERTGIKVKYFTSVEFPLIHSDFLSSKFPYFGKCIVLVGKNEKR